MNVKRLPWWLEEGAEACPFCEIRLHFEAMAFCAGCDRPICATCLIERLETRTVLCPQCHAGQGGA